MDGKSPKKSFFSTKKKRLTEDENRLDLFEKNPSTNEKVIIFDNMKFLFLYFLTKINTKN
jgi:hypothetical protein